MKNQFLVMERNKNRKPRIVQVEKTLDDALHTARGNERFFVYIFNPRKYVAPHEYTELEMKRAEFRGHIERNIAEIHFQNKRARMNEIEFINSNVAEMNDYEFIHYERVTKHSINRDRVCKILGRGYISPNGKKTWVTAW